MQRISITIDDHLKTELDTITAKGERAAFISLAIQKAVMRRVILLAHSLYKNDEGGTMKIIT
ncbi:MAG: hypothetical protein GQ582_09980 [Methyloprofundus sp.]|nr:hypothetical protein [Methyloprofundus sp.]